MLLNLINRQIKRKLDVLPCQRLRYFRECVFPKQKPERSFRNRLVVVGLKTPEHRSHFTDELVFPLNDLGSGHLRTVLWQCQNVLKERRRNLISDICLHISRYREVCARNHREERVPTDLRGCFDVVIAHSARKSVNFLECSVIWGHNRGVRQSLTRHKDGFTHGLQCIGVWEGNHARRPSIFFPGRRIPSRDDEGELLEAFFPYNVLGFCLHPKLFVRKVLRQERVRDVNPFTLGYGV